MDSKLLMNNFTALLKTYKSDPQKSGLKECIQKLKSQSQSQEDLRSLLRRDRSIVETILMLVNVSKVPQGTVDLVYSCAEAGMFSRADISHLLEKLCRPGWPAQSRLKILQMAFHFIRYDIYSDGEVLVLLWFVFSCMDATESHVSSAARPLAIQLTDKILKRSVQEERSRCDMECAALRKTAEESTEEGGNAQAHANGELKSSRSEENIKSPIVDESGNVLEILGYLYEQIVKAGNYKVSYFVLLILRYPGIMAVMGVQEFVREKFFSMASTVLKSGNSQRSDRMNIMEIVLILESEHNRLFAEQLSLLYQSVPEYYDDGNEDFFRFVHRLAKLRMKSAVNGTHGAHGTLQVSEDVATVVEMAVGKLDPSKKTEQHKLDFIKEMLELYRGNEAFYKKHMEAVAAKLGQAQQTSVSTDQIIGNGLRWSVGASDRALFNELLSLCSADSLPSIGTRFRAFMGDNWSVLFSKCTAEQKQSLIGETGQFSIAELEEFVQHVDIQLIPDVLGCALDKMIESSNVTVVLSLLKRVEDFTVFRSLLVQFYVALQNKCHGPSRAAPADDGSLFTLSSERLSQLAVNPYRSVKPVEPLKLLRTKLDENPAYYAEALSCIEEIIKIVTIPDAWPIIFDILNLRPDRVDEQLPLVQLIAQKYLDNLPDVFISEMLGLIKRMSTASDYNTCLNALCVFQEIGEFLMNRRSLEGGGAKGAFTEEATLEKPEVNSGNGANKGRRNKNRRHRSRATENPSESNPLSVGSGHAVPEPVLWKEYLLAGAYIARDDRNFVILSAMQYVFAFLASEYARMTADDQQFVERVVFDTLYKITDHEVTMLTLDEMNNFLRNRPSGAYLGGYLKHLAGCVSGGDLQLAAKAIDGLGLITSVVYSEMYYVVCEKVGEQPPNHNADHQNAGPSRSDIGGRRPFTGFEYPKMAVVTDECNFILRGKREHPSRSALVGTFFPVVESFIDSKSKLLPNMLELLPCFCYSEEELSRLTSLLGRLVTAMPAYSAELVRCTEALCISSQMAPYSLTVFSKWLQSADICGSPHAADADRRSAPGSFVGPGPLTDSSVAPLLLNRLGELMKKIGWCEEREAALSAIYEFSDADSFDAVLACLIRGYATIGCAEQFAQLVAFTERLLLGKEKRLIETRRHERKLLEFLEMYSAAIRQYRVLPVSDDILHRELPRAYSLLAALSRDSFKTMRLKCYQIMFIGMLIAPTDCRDILVDCLRCLLASFIRDFPGQGMALGSVRQLEVAYALRCMVRLADKTIVEILKNELNELILTMDADILRGVKDCFQVLFSAQ